MITDTEWLSEVSRLQDCSFPSSAVYDGAIMTMPGLCWLLIQENLPKPANEDYSIFELKMISEMFQHGISEPGALK